MCRLVDQLCTLGYRHPLEGELRLVEVRSPGVYDFTAFLPEFGEKGVVTTVEAASGLSDTVIGFSIFLLIYVEFE